MYVNSYTAYIIWVLFFVKFSQQRALDPKQHLHKYGYLNSTEIDDKTMTAAVKEYQNFYGLSATGELDDATMVKMSRPRCGMPDNVPHYVRKYQWRKNHLTYKIRNWTSLSLTQIRNVFDGAIKVWTNNVNMTISESQTDVADIDVHFSMQDGSYNILGYAHFPENGDIYFDQAERWTVKKRPEANQIYFGWVAAHEMGHSLGLDHINSVGSIMNPYYSTEITDASASDVNNLRHIYGSASALNNTALCEDPSVDAMLFSRTHRILIKKKQYWTLAEQTLENGPFPLESLFPELPDDIDAAFSVGKSIYFLKGNTYYRFKDKRKNYTTKLIRIGFDNVTSNIDAAFFEPISRTIYFFKGAKYYTFHVNGKKGERVDLNGKQISEYWNGIPDDVESATLFENTTILFIKKGTCYVFDFMSKKLLSKKGCKATLYKCS